MIGAVLGAVFALGLLTIYSALLPTAALSNAAEGLVSSSPQSQRRANRHRQQPKVLGSVQNLDATGVVVAVMVAFAVWLLTEWWLLAAFSAMGALLGPRVLRSGSAEAQHSRENEAIAIWVESLRDTMRASRGVQGAITANIDTAPELLRPPLAKMAKKICHGLPTEYALVEFANELKNPLADLVVAVLVEALSGSAGRLPKVLEEIAVSARSRSVAHLEVHTSRSRARTSLKLVLIVSALSVLSFFIAFEEYLAPLRSGSGQLLAALIMACMSSCLFWIARLSEIPTPKRIIDPGASLSIATPMQTSGLADSFSSRDSSSQLIGPVGVLQRLLHTKPKQHSVGEASEKCGPSAKAAQHSGQDFGQQIGPKVGQKKC